MKRILFIFTLFSFHCTTALFADQSYRLELQQKIESVHRHCAESVAYLDDQVERKSLQWVAQSLEEQIKQLDAITDTDSALIYAAQQQAQEILQAAILVRTQPANRAEALSLMQQRSSLTPQQILEQQVITLTIEEFEQKYADLLVEDVSIIQTYKRIFFKTLLEFLFGVISESVKKEAVKKTEEDPLMRVYSIGEKALPSIARRWPEIVTELMKYVTIFATDKILPNHKPSIKQKYAELLVPRIIGKTLAKAVTFDWKTNTHGKSTGERIGKFVSRTGTSLFMESLMLIILVRGYSNKKDAYYKYLDMLARIAPFTLGSDSFKSALFNGKNLTQFFSEENPLLKENAALETYRLLGNIAVDGLEGMVIYGAAESIAKKVIPDWMSVPARKQLAKGFREIVKQIIVEGDPCRN